MGSSYARSLNYAATAPKRLVSSDHLTVMLHTLATSALLPLSSSLLLVLLLAGQAHTEAGA